MEEEKYEFFLNHLSKQNVRFNYNYDNNRMKTVDNTNSLISLVDVFYDRGIGHFPPDKDEIFLPPTQKEFATSFYQRNEKEDSTLFTDEYENEWKYRAIRAWPSFVRDVQFYFLASVWSSRGIFEEVSYSRQKDIQDGVDCIIEYEGDSFFIDLYVDSRKSRKFLEVKKQNRGHDKSHVHIHLTVDRHDSRNQILQTNGQELWLYSEEHLEDLKDKIESVKLKN